VVRGRTRPSPAAAGPGWLGVVATVVGIALMGAVVLAVPDLRHAVSAAIGGDTSELRREVKGLGATGVLIVLAMALIHAVVFYPAEILTTASGFAYGFWLGLPIVMAGWLASALVAYGIGHAAARPLLYRLAGEERFRRGERLVHSGGVSLLLVVRLIPLVPFDLVCYACGAARIPLGRYVWTTIVGYLPITAVFVYFGSRLESLSPSDPLLLASAVVLVALIATTRWLAPKLAAADSEPT
jgi:uncharacterized membrane protein YdjX (TVP38/TMEM64 family)